MAKDRTFNADIATALQASRVAFVQTFFQKVEMTNEERHLALRIIMDPVWRPLCELIVNGATDFTSGQYLLSLEYVDLGSCTIRSGPHVGSVVETLEVSEAGQHYFHDVSKIQRQTDTDWEFRTSLIDCLTLYAVIDFGSGIVARRSAIEAAVDIDDFEILNRIRSIEVRKYQLQRLPVCDAITPTKRGMNLQKFFDWDPFRVGGRIVELGYSSYVYPSSH